MKKIILLFFILLIVYTPTINCQTIDNLDSKNGYKDLKLGTPKSLIKDKIYDCTPSGNCLLKGDDYRKIGNVIIDQVWLKFSDDKLFFILLELSGQENVDNLMSIYVETFGKATSREKDQLIVYWEGKDVVLRYEIIIGDDATVKATAIISSKSLLEKDSKIEVDKNLKDL
jgi:hypothetical protein